MPHLLPLLSCLLSLPLLLFASPLPLRAAEGLPAAPQAAVDALSLERDIHHFMRHKKVLAGVALLTEDGLCAGVHMDAPFPLLSVIKFPLAVAVLEKTQREHIPLTALLPVRAEQLHSGTHSPLRDQRGRRDMEVSLRDLLRYSVSLSDNNACDVLLDFVGGPAVVEACARRLGAADLYIGHGEDWMHRSLYHQYANWGTPRSMARMMLGFFTDHAIPQEHRELLASFMGRGPGIPGKILDALPDGLHAGHKTGSSDISAQGLRPADNDLAFFRLPDGRYVALAVFLLNSLESPDEDLRIIRELARLSIDWLARQPVPLQDGHGPSGR